MKSLPIVTLPAPSSGGAPDAPGTLPTTPSTARPGLASDRGGPSGGLAPSHLADLDLAARRAAVSAVGEPGYRAGQVSRHYFARLVRDPSAMTDLPAAARERITDALLPTLLTSVRESSCDDGLTRKLLWRLHDGALVESVLMAYPASDRSEVGEARELNQGRGGRLARRAAGPVRGHRTSRRVTACVSSQAGCGMGCPFCATGQAGLTRNLSTAEIVDQVVSLATVANQEWGQRLSHVVFMGMGEPLANYPRVVSAVRRLVSPPPEGLGLSQRHITISTVGLVPAMRRLADEGLAATLAISLHAPDDDLRDELVPVNQRWKIAEVLEAGWEYAARTGRRLSIEYAMIRDVNDHPWRAARLAQLLAGRPVHVNLIPLNPTPGSRWDASAKPVEREFVGHLRAAGITTTVRDTRGREIDGACGQLAAELTTGQGWSAGRGSADGLSGTPNMRSERLVRDSSEPRRSEGDGLGEPKPVVGRSSEGTERSDR